MIVCISSKAELRVAMEWNILSKFPKDAVASTVCDRKLLAEHITSTVLGSSCTDYENSDAKKCGSLLRSWCHGKKEVYQSSSIAFIQECLLQVEKKQPE